jgi:hypothetical protein
MGGIAARRGRALVINKKGRIAAALSIRKTEGT